MERADQKAHPAQHDNNLSVRGMSREEIGTLLATFVTFFLKQVVDNRDFALMLAKNANQLETFFVTKQKDSQREGHFLYFRTSGVDDEIGHLMSLTRITRGVEPGDFGSRHWQVKLQKEAHVRNVNGTSKKINFVGIETKTFCIDNDDFGQEMITALVAQEESYIRTSFIKRFMKEHRRYELDRSNENMLNLWIVINRLLTFSVKIGTSWGDLRHFDQQYIPLRFSTVRNNDKKTYIKYDRVWQEYEIKNVQQ